MSNKYNSFFCPKLLLDTYMHLQDRWAGEKNIAKVLYLSTTYMLQNPEIYKPKEVFIDDELDVEKVMIRVSEPLLGGIQDLIEKYHTDKTSLYVFAFSNFIDVLEGIIDELQGNTFAYEVGEDPETNLDGRLIIQEKKLAKLFPDEEDREVLVQDKFRMGAEMLCIVDKISIYKLKVSKLFKKDKYSPEKLYKNFYQIG